MPSPPRRSSFDALAPPDPQPVMGTLADEHIRDVAALLPSRNPDRMFSDAPADSPAKPSNHNLHQQQPQHHPAERPAAAGKSNNQNHATDDDGDDATSESSSQYYYYTSEAGAETRAGFDDDGHSESTSDESGDEDDDDDATTADNRRPHHDPRSPHHAGGGPVARRGYAALTQTIAGSASYARDNIADAVAVAASRFATDDVSKIAAILRRRLDYLLPALRRLAAHCAAFFSGLSHLQKTLSAVSRSLASDARLQELAARTGVASKEVLRVALVVAKALLNALLSAYHVMVEKVIPSARKLLPRAYSKVVFRALRAARNSPWAVAVGPATLSLALHARKLPDPLTLHRAFGVGMTRSVRGSYEAIVGSAGAESEDDSSVDGGGAGRDGGDATSLSYTYTYGTVTTRAPGGAADADVDGGGGGGGARSRRSSQGAAATSGEYYYTYGSGTYGGGRDEDVEDGGGEGGMPLGDANAGGGGGRGNVGRREKSGERGDYGKENDLRRSFGEQVYDEGGDGMYDY